MFGVLKYTFGLVNDWLKFAENKNAGIFVATTGGTIGLILLFDSFINQPLYTMQWIFSIYYWNAVMFLCLSSIASLVSFLPQIPFFWISSTENPKDEDNLFFYSDIAKYDSGQYLASLKSKYRLKFDKSRNLLLDLSTQIIINARIALRKYRLFKIAVWLLICAILTPIGAALFKPFVRGGETL